MICLNCGTQNDEGISFCRTCGMEMPKTAPLSSDSPSSAANKAKEPESATAQRAKVSDLVGQTLDMKYHIIAKLGSGGMGSVYKARRIHIGDLVAIKVLHSELVGDQQAIERFRREAQAAARLKHVNAVGIHDFAASGGGFVYIVMELVEGKSLGTIMKEQGPLDPSFVAEILSKVCSALDEAHRQNIVHRDLKPDNILVGRARGGVEVKVLDFGIAKLRDLAPEINTLTEKGMLVGTPLYMSPEQCMGDEIDRRSDIYSLGVVLYEMLTGVLPFHSPIPTAIIVQHVTMTPQPLREINSETPPGVEKAVMRALQKRKEERQQTAGALAAEFASGMKRAAAVGSTKKSSRQANPLEGPGWAEAAAREEAKQKDDTIASTVTAYELTAQADENKRKNYRAIGIVSVVVLALLLTATLFLIRSRTAVSSQGGNSNASLETAENKLPNNTERASLPLSPPEPPGGMVYVAGGEFIMGRDNGAEYEKPQHQATVNPFFIDIFEVTCEEYKKFINETGYRAPTEWSKGNYLPAWARRPVTGIDWDDANAYARWAGKRLPTEQEWEFAARGADGRLYPWGNEWKAKAANADSSSHKHVTSIGEHSAGPSPFGAYDMSGNVWEWTASDLAAYPGGMLTGQAQGDMKVVRGGSWRENRSETTATVRKGLPPRGGEYSNVGFRCVSDVIRSPDSR
jgi:eukaryotic-like serine/threonine-protein kinase